VQHRKPSYDPELHGKTTLRRICKGFLEKVS